MKVELAIARTNQLIDGAMPRLEKILLKILSNQFEDCSSVLRLAGSDELSVYVGEKEVKKTADAKAENDALQRRLDNGGRVLVKGKCSVPATTEAASTSGVGQDATVELADVTGRNVLGIRAGIISDQTSLRVLQEYIKEQMQK